MQTCTYAFNTYKSVSIPFVDICKLKSDAAIKLKSNKKQNKSPHKYNHKKKNKKYSTPKTK